MSNIYAKISTTLRSYIQSLLCMWLRNKYWYFRTTSFSIPEQITFDIPCVHALLINKWQIFSPHRTTYHIVIVRKTIPYIWGDSQSFSYLHVYDSCHSCFHKIAFPSTDRSTGVRSHAMVMKSKSPNNEARLETNYKSMFLRYIWLIIYYHLSVINYIVTFCQTQVTKWMYASVESPARWKI